jgi:hypothetical protein
MNEKKTVSYRFDESLEGLRERLKTRLEAKHLWLTPVILADQEDHSLKPARANSFRVPRAKNPS